MFRTGKDREEGWRDIVVVSKIINLITPYPLTVMQRYSYLESVGIFLAFS